MNGCGEPIAQSQYPWGLLPIELIPKDSHGISIARTAAQSRQVSEQTKQSFRRNTTRLCVSRIPTCYRPHRSRIPGCSGEMFQEEVWLRDLPSESFPLWKNKARTVRLIKEIP